MLPSFARSSETEVNRSLLARCETRAGDQGEPPEFQADHRETVDHYLGGQGGSWWRICVESARKNRVTFGFSRLVKKPTRIAARGYKPCVPLGSPTRAESLDADVDQVRGIGSLDGAEEE